MRMGSYARTLRRQNLQRRSSRSNVHLHPLNSIRSWRPRAETFESARSVCATFLFSDDYSCTETRGRRLSLLIAGIFCASLAVVARLSFMQTNQHQKWMRLADRQHQTSMHVSGARGSIHDVFGRPLALSLETLSIGVHPERIKDPAQYAATLAPLIDLKPSEVLEKIKSSKPFVPLARGVSKDRLPAIQLAGLQGLEIDQEFRRSYPQENLARQILGQVSLDGRGQSGIELRFNRALSAASTTHQVRRDAKGRFLTGAPDDESSAGFPLDFNLFRASASTPAMDDSALIREEGGDVQLTLDSIVQGILEEEFQAARTEAKAKRVFGMILDADTGEIVALGQSPSLSGREGAFLSPDELRNYPLQDSFEPGSTFKPLIAASALDQKLVRAEELIDCQNGRYVVGKHTIRDVHPVGVVPFSEVLVRSSNVGIAKIGARLGKERLDQALKTYGFGSTTGVELPGEGTGVLHKLSNWKPIDTATTSFGQGISVTAIQMVRAYASLANGGYLIKPTLIRSDRPIERQRILSERVANQVAEILVGVTEGEHGTGKNAAIKGVAVSGKTGTAQKPKLKGRGYDSERILASFIGFIDGRKLGVDRRFVMYVAVDEPGVYPRWGGTLAAPVFRKTMTRVLSHYLVQGDGALRTASFHLDRAHG